MDLQRITSVRVCKVFDKALIFYIGPVCLHSTPLECGRLTRIFL